uniref:Uncharacterized protein n=1 Tax=Oryza sativa subsp. japonica TaxID=39947 RepID=Q9FW11_ORYSJ|nr:hypothetical protein [Oryza sativa Japonica Group]
MAGAAPAPPRPTPHLLLLILCRPRPTPPLLLPARRRPAARWQAPPLPHPLTPVAGLLQTTRVCSSPSPPVPSSHAAFMAGRRA